MQNSDKLLELVYHKSELILKSKKLKNFRIVSCKIYSKSILNTLFISKPHQSHHQFFKL